MYFDYRFRASRDNLTLRNRARAAEILGISESSLSNYETGKTKCVPAEMVDQMATVYKAPELRNIYCMTECPIGCHKNLASCEAEIEKVVVHLISTTEPKILTNIMTKLVQIAADGEIDENEKSALKEIADIFNKLTFALSEFFVLAERQGAI